MFMPRRLRDRAGYITVALVTALVALAPSNRAVDAQSNGRVKVLIGFRNTPGAAEQAIVRAAGGNVTHTYTVIPAIAANLPEQALAGLSRNPRVSVIEPDVQVFALDAFSDELGATWGVNRVGGGTSATGGAGVKVAVIDSGVDCNHPELKRNGVSICAAGWDFVNNDNDPFDDNGHGTHVSGTIAAAKNGSGVVGVAPGVTLYPLKVLDATGSGDFSDVIAAVQWAQSHGIQITSNSYGSNGDPGTLVKAAFDNSATTVLHIAAAGNAGTCQANRDTVGYPAKYSSVVAVAATNSSNTRPCFSSTGAKVELAAPGVSVTSTVPSAEDPSGFATWNGTSMATPHVTGVAALVMAAGVTSPSAVRSILQSTATDLGVAGRDTFYGYGLVNATAAVAAAGGGGGGSTPPPPALSAASVAYALASGNKHLKITVTIVSNNVPFAGAAVSVQVKRNGAAYATGTATTGSTGQVAFQINNAPAGTYTTTITNVTATGYTWDGVQPSDPGYTK